MENSLSICEIFYSIQGESTYAGFPCIFIRMAECNLNCSYCDTKYSHAPQPKVPISEIMAKVAQYPARLVEITGGEPLLQDNVTDLMEQLHEQGYEILLETNGSMYLGEVPDYVRKIVDVKTPGSGHGDSFPKWNLRYLQPHDELKFVMTSHYDYNFAKAFINTHELGNKTLLFSPVTNLLSAETLAEWMLRDGIKARLQIQLHRIINLR